MRLQVPALAPRLTLKDVYGQPVTIGGASGRRTLLCFFRDAGCPFCNFHLYLLSNRYASLAAHGLTVIALFYSTPAEVKRVACRERRPFPVIADADSIAYDAYRIEHSFGRKLKATFTRMPTLLKGLRMVGLAGFNTNNIVPADFLIDEDGRIAEAYYGRDAGDHIPFQRIEAFASHQAEPPPDRRQAA